MTRACSLARRAISLTLAAGGTCASSVALADGSVTYDFRQQASVVILPRHDYGVQGMCTTTSGVAPASVYVDGGSGRGQAFGLGVGGRVAYHHIATVPGPPGSTWWGLRAGGGLDLGLLYGKADTGIADVSGTLCQRLKSDGAPVQYSASPMLLFQAMALLGGEVGVVTGMENGAWHGLVFGASWTPTLTNVKPWVADGDTTVSVVAMDLTLDFVSGWRGAEADSGKRIAVSLVLPEDGSGPVLLTLSFGAVWR